MKRLTISPPGTPVVQYTNSLDLHEAPSSSASRLDPNCLALRQHFHSIWTTIKHFENCRRQEIQQMKIDYAGLGSRMGAVEKTENLKQKS